MNCELWIGCFYTALPKGSLRGGSLNRFKSERQKQDGGNLKRMLQQVLKSGWSLRWIERIEKQSEYLLSPNKAYKRIQTGQQMESETSTLQRSCQKGHKHFFGVRLDPFVPFHDDLSPRKDPLREEGCC